MVEDVIVKLNKVSSPSSDEVLEYARVNGIINIEEAQEQAHIMNLEKMIIPNHSCQIWQGKNGRWNCYIPDDLKPEGRRRISSKNKKKLLEKLASTDPEKYTLITEGATMRDLYPKWIKEKAEWVEENTISRNELDWRKYYLNDSIIDIPMSQLKKGYIEKWLLGLINNHNMTKTNFANVSSIIRQMFEFAYEEELIQDNPMLRVKKKIYKRCRPTIKVSDDLQVYTDTEVEMMRALIMEKMKTRGKRQYQLAPLAILFQFYTGMRIGEVCSLKYSDIDLNGYALVHTMLARDTGKIRERTKGSLGYRKIHLSQSAIEIVKYTVDYKGHSEGFIFSIDDSPLAERVINEYLKRYCKELNIPYRSSHKLRKTALSSMVASGMSIPAVSKYAGHTAESTLLNHYLYDRNGEYGRNKQIDDALSYR